MTEEVVISVEKGKKCAILADEKIQLKFEGLHSFFSGNYVIVKFSKKRRLMKPQTGKIFLKTFNFEFQTQFFKGLGHNNTKII